MARKRYIDEDILRLLREIEVHPFGASVVFALRCETVHSAEKTH